MEKDKYYDPAEKGTVESIRGSRELSTAISFVRHIYSEWRSHRAMEEGLKEIKIDQVTELVRGLADTSTNFRKVVEGVINIRH